MTPAGDVAEQKRRRELIRYPIIHLFEFSAKLLPGSSVGSKWHFNHCTGSHSHNNFKAAVGIYPIFSKIYGRRYLTIGLVHGHTTCVDADEKNRGLNSAKCMLG